MGGIMMVIIVFAIFQLAGDNPYWIYIGIPIFAYVIGFLINLATQLPCGTVNVGKAALGALPTLGCTGVALLISWITVFRVIVSSVTAPMFISDLEDISAARRQSGGRRMRGGGTRAILEVVERENPLIKGMSYGFYLFFAMLYGGVMGSSIASIC
jgi:hypothetical protein